LPGILLLLFLEVQDFELHPSALRLQPSLTVCACGGDSVIMQPMKHFITIGISILFAFAHGTLTFAQVSTLPDGWRYPTPEETYIDDGPFKGNNKYLKAFADFNGDKYIDTAMILMREDGSGIGLFVFLKSDGRDTAILLDTVDNANSAKYMGVSVAKAGTFKTACAKGYGPPCGKDEPEEVTVPFRAIDFFAFESSNSYFYWDTSDSKFKRVWISD
jgi:hypothetical protein